MVMEFLCKKCRASLCPLRGNRPISWDASSLMLCDFVRRICRYGEKFHCTGRHSIFKERGASWETQPPLGGIGQETSRQPSLSVKVFAHLRPDLWPKYEAV